MPVGYHVIGNGKHKFGKPTDFEIFGVARKNREFILLQLSLKPNKEFLKYTNFTML